MSLALYRKWRPMTFSDVVGQPQVTETLKKQIAGGRLSHAYLFTGTRGTGKTTCAKLLAKAANCLDLRNGEPCNECAACRAINEGAAVDVSEIDAASNTGVDNIRAIRDEAAYSPVELRHRVYIIDECHMLTNGAWNALLKILEEPPEHVIFIFASTELHKIPATILSRCQRYSFRRGNARDLATRVSEIAAAEHIKLTEDGAAALARLADGAFRDAISMLDQCAAAKGDTTLDEAAILDELGLAGSDDTLAILQSIASGDTAEALATLDRLYSAGKDMAALLGELSAAVRDTMILLTTKSPALLGGRYPSAALGALGLDAPTASVMLGAVSDAQVRLARSSSARTEVELCIVKLANIAAGGEALPVLPTARPAQAARPPQASTSTVVPAPTSAPTQQVSKPKPAAKPVQQASAPAAVPAPTSAPTQQVSKPEPAAKPVQQASAPAAAAAPQSAPAEQPAPAKHQSAPAKPEEPDDAPPWDEVPPPPEEGRPVFSMGDLAEPEDDVPPPEEEISSAFTFAAEPEQPKAAAAPANGRWWQDVMLDVRDRLPISQYMQLSAQPAATLEGDVVIITVTSEFAKKIVGDIMVLEAVAASASKVLGRTVTARCKLAGEDDDGKPDAFDELISMQTKFDNFTISD